MGWGGGLRLAASLRPIAWELVVWPGLTAITAFARVSSVLCFFGTDGGLRVHPSQSPAVSSHEGGQPVYLGPRFLDASAWFAAVSQLMPGGGIELAPELWKAERINEATMEGGETQGYEQ